MTAVVWVGVQRTPVTTVEWAVRYPNGRVHVVDPPSGPIAEGQARDLAGWHPDRKLLRREVTDWTEVPR